ncbi:substrate-binding periplasmic protein [Bdellovibrio sp. GT3]|uniref:substrate-binding periplasmic protein n=1 Tax=Bdellovibrio sp. GT3 TaxID=3136282 RepID=UPI0030F32E57
MKFLLGLILCVGVVAEAAIKESKVLRVGAINSPPHVTDLQTNPPQGAFIEFFSKKILPDVLSKHHYKVEWNASPLKRQFRDLEVGQLDLLLMVVRTPEREKIYDYSVQPLVREQPAMVVRKSLFKNHGAVSIKEFSGKTVGLVTGALIPDFFKKHRIDYIPVAGDDAGDRIPNLVETQRIDGAFIYLKSIADGVAQKYKNDNLKSLLIYDVPAYSMYIAYSKKVPASIRNEIDAQLALHLKEYKIK